LRSEPLHVLSPWGSCFLFKERVHHIRMGNQLYVAFVRYAGVCSCRMRESRRESPRDDKGLSAYEVSVKKNSDSIIIKLFNTLRAGLAS